MPVRERGQGEPTPGQHVPFSGHVQAHTPGERRAFAPAATEDTGERDSPLERRRFELLVPLVKRDGVFQDHPDRPPGPFLLRENQLTRSREGTSPNPEGSATVQMALSTSRAINRRDYRGCR